MKIKVCKRCGNEFEETSKYGFIVHDYCPECYTIITSPSSCNGCAYLETREDLVFTDSFLAYNETRTVYKCLKLNIAVTEPIHECPYRKTIQEVMDEASIRETGDGIL